MIVVPSSFGVTVFHTLWFSMQTSKLWITRIAIVYEEHSGKKKYQYNSSFTHRAFQAPSWAEVFKILPESHTS